MKKTLTPHFVTLPCDSETPVSLYEKLAKPHAYAFLLESAETAEQIGRYSVIGFDPLMLEIFPAGEKVTAAKNPLKILQKKFESINYKADARLPRLQAGFVGYFSYEVARHFEKLNLPTAGAEIPEGIFFLPKNLLIFDHEKRTLTLICSSKNDLDALQKSYEKIQESYGLTPLPHDANTPPPSPENYIIKQKTAAPFEDLVLEAKEKICVGEVFQIVICQTFRQTTTAKPFDLYRRLRIISPSPYMYYLQYPDFSIVGSSPETLVRTEDDEIIIRPLAGTRRRGKTPEDDKRLADELLHDEKEQAEHMMLVDLGRNDVGRVAQPGSVHVTRMMEVEKFSHVMHLVSEVRGKRMKNRSLFDIFQMAFPAGTLTGAPKLRAMEIIADFEQQPRGIYGGAVGYFDLSGNMDFAIAIRTMVYKKGVVTLRAGAGIVFDSKPALEHIECCNKARAPLTAVA